MPSEEEGVGEKNRRMMEQHRRDVEQDDGAWYGTTADSDAVALAAVDGMTSTISMSLDSSSARDFFAELSGTAAAGSKAAAASDLFG